MTNQNRLIDSAALTLLANQAPVPLGIKVSLMKEYLTREDYPMSPDRLVGNPKGDEGNFSLFDDYTDRVGYQFHWGFITEEYEAAIPDSQNDLEREAALTHQVIPERVLQKFQRADIFDRMFIHMYAGHPFADERFSSNEGNDHQAVHSLSAYGEEEIAALRVFMCEVYLPYILPDLLATLEKLLTLRDSNEAQFDTMCAEWTIGKFGTEELVLRSSHYTIPTKDFQRFTYLPPYLSKFTSRPSNAIGNQAKTVTPTAIGSALGHTRKNVGNIYLSSAHASVEKSVGRKKHDIDNTHDDAIETYCGPIPVNLGTIADKHTEGTWTRDCQPGYRFEWGCLVEDFSPADPACPPDEILGQDNIQYTVLVDDLYKAFNRPMRPPEDGGDELEIFFCNMYYKHPLHHSHYQWEDPILENGVMSFIGVGKTELIELRQWIFDVFLPKILPDMMATAHQLAALRTEDEANFRIQFGKWLVENDESKLIFASSAMS
jgi:hypothetical protein